MGGALNMALPWTLCATHHSLRKIVWALGPEIEAMLLDGREQEPAIGIFAVGIAADLARFTDWTIR